MFIIRTVFWLSLVVLFLPAGTGEEGSDANNVGASEAFSVAQTTMGDLAKFCQRNPAACDTGNQVVSSFGQKARYGAQIVYEYLDDKFGDNQTRTSTDTKSADNS